MDTKPKDWLDSTLQFPIVSLSKKRRPNWLLILALIATHLAFFGAGLLASKTKPAKMEAVPKVSAKQKETMNSILTEYENELNVRAREKIISFLANIKGVLEIKDDEAQTVLHKRAAIANKTGFTDLPNGVAFRVYSYFIFENTGYGIAGDESKNLFLVIWTPDKIKAPALNPGFITIVTGRQVQTGL